MKKTITIKEMEAELFKNGKSIKSFYNWIATGKIKILGSTNNTASREDFYKCLNTNFKKQNCGRKLKVYKKENKDNE